MATSSILDAQLAELQIGETPAGVLKDADDDTRAMMRTKCEYITKP
jgi:hypothetical protein